MIGKLNLALLKWRRKEGKSQLEVSEIFGVSQSTLHKWECGKSEIPLKLYPKVCQLLSLPLKDFLPSEIINQLDWEDEKSKTERERYLILLEENNSLLRQRLADLESRFNINSST